MVLSMNRQVTQKQLPKGKTKIVQNTFLNKAKLMESFLKSKEYVKVLKSKECVMNIQEDKLGLS